MDIQLKNGEILAWAGISNEVYTAVQTAEGSEFTANKNKFLSALINKIAVTRVEKASISNPFAQFDSFPIQYGDTIENVFTEIPMGYDYDISTAGTNLLQPAKPPVKSLYATMNYQKQYKITVYDTQIRLAVKNEYGLQNLVEYLIGAMYDSGDIDEYFAQIAMLSTQTDMYKNGIETIEVASANYAHDITAKIIEVVNNFKYPNVNNNKMGVINPTPLSNALLVIKQTTYDKINLDFLAGVFNLSKVDLIKRIVTVESFIVPVWNVTTQKAEMKGNDMDFAVIDTRGLDNHLALNTSGLFYNPEGLFTNHYHNRWRLYGYKTWYNARAFKYTITQ